MSSNVKSLPIVSREMIENAFLPFLKAGDTVMIHSSLNSIGFIEDGPLAIVEEVLKIIGDKGNLIMMSGTNSFSKTKVFDLKNTKSETGLLTEQFRLMKGVKRSPVPMESYVAYGPEAEKFVQVYNSYLDESSPLIKLLDLDGKIVLLGVTYNKCTLFHLSEERHAVDYNFYKKFEGLLIDENGAEKPVSQNYFVRKDLKTKKDVNWVGELMEKENLVSVTKLGAGKVKSFKARDFDNYCMKVLQKDRNAFMLRKR